MRILVFFILLFSLFLGKQNLSNEKELTNSNCFNIKRSNKPTLQKTSAENNNAFLLEETELQEDSINCRKVKRGAINKNNIGKIYSFNHYSSLNKCLTTSKYYINYYKKFSSFINSTPNYIVLGVLKI